MNNTTISSLIDEHFKAWPHFQPDRNATDNINFKVPSDGIWYRLTIQHGINVTVGMASKPCVRETGIVTIQVFYPNNKNTMSVKRLADSLGDHFQHHHVGNLKLRTSSANDVPNREDGYQINVNIPYWYN